MSPAIETQAVVKTYVIGSSAVNAVDHVSFNLEPGQFVALVGPSGSGKTTLLAMLAGLLTPTSGNILIDGQDLGQMDRGERAQFRRRKIGFTFQSNNLLPYLTALENVELLLRLNGELDNATRQRARDLLARLGLSDRLNNLPRQLSGGQQQRVAIARALINQPTVVLADEPTSALDTERAFQVVQTMADLVHERGHTGIIVTHDLRLVEHTDRVIQLVDGRLFRILDSRADLACLANPANCDRIPLSALGVNGEAAA